MISRTYVKPATVSAAGRDTYSILNGRVPGPGPDNDISFDIGNIVMLKGGRAFPGGRNKDVKMFGYLFNEYNTKKCQ